MSTKMPTCCGCFVNSPKAWSESDAHMFQMTQPGIIRQGLTYEETECLRHLADAWELFSKLENKHPDDDAEFRTAIHDAQKMIALRVAGRVDTHIWKQPE